MEGKQDGREVGERECISLSWIHEVHAEHQLGAQEYLTSGKRTKNHANTMNQEWVIALHLPSVVETEAEVWSSQRQLSESEENI